MSDDDNSKRYIPMNPEQREAFSKTLHDNLLAKAEQEWNENILKKYSQRLNLGQLEKTLFELGYGLAIQSYTTYLTAHCFIGVKVPPQTAQEEPMPPTEQAPKVN